MLKTEQTVLTTLLTIRLIGLLIMVILIMLTLVVVGFYVQLQVGLVSILMVQPTMYYQMVQVYVQALLVQVDLDKIIKR